MAIHRQPLVKFRARRTINWTASIQPGLLQLDPSTHPHLFGHLDASRRRFLVADQTAFDKHGERILAQLDRYGVEHSEPLLIPGGEAAKCQSTVETIWAAMNEWGVPRFNEPGLVFASGSVHDVVGYAFATWRRSVPYIVFGTTLVAAIDAMFALKVSINEFWKNRVGFYHPPLAAYADPIFFSTLTLEQILEGVAEIFKVAVCMHRRLFRLLEAHGRRVIDEFFQGTDRATIDIQRYALVAMARELSGNPYEHNPRRRSYGGHDISTGMEPDVPHGVAVILNLLWSTMVSWRSGHIGRARRDRIVRLAGELGLPLWHPVLEDVDRLRAALDDTAHHRGGLHLVPAPGPRLGRAVFIKRITDDQFRRGLDDLYDLAA